MPPAPSLRFILPLLLAGTLTVAAAQPAPQPATPPDATVPASETDAVPAPPAPAPAIPAPLKNTPKAAVEEEAEDADLPSLPSDVILPPDQTVLQYLLKHGYFGGFPEGLFKPAAAMTRGEFALLLYRASALNTPFVSEFPYYRDVATTHAAYRAIEALRMRHIIAVSGTDGTFRPEAPVTRATAAGMLSRSFGASWLTLTNAEIAETYSAYAQPIQAIPEDARVDIARVVYTGYLLPIPVNNPKAGGPGWSLALNAPLTRMDAARMIFRRTQITEREKRPELRENLWLPPGVTFNVTPTTAISSEQLSVGGALFFATNSTVAIEGTEIELPRGTRLRGKVVQISLDKLNADIVLDRVSLPSGTAYNLSSRLTLAFKLGDKKTPDYIVPGQDFQITTLSPP